MGSFQISTDFEYRNALREIEKRMSALAGSKDGECLDSLVTAVVAYEHTHYALEQIGSSENKHYLRMRK